jgi:hypothetical protein
MSEMSGDREKILSAFGGKRGILDSTIPSFLFLMSFNFTKNLEVCMYISVAAAAGLFFWRLFSRESVVQALSGFIGVAFCGWLAWKTGDAKDYYQPSLWKNSIFLTVYLVSILVKWPVIGLVLGPILGEDLAWRKDKKRLSAYIKATWIRFALFAVRLAIQYPLYKAGQFNALGIANLFLGFPLYALTLWGTWMVIKSVPLAQKSD